MASSAEGGDKYRDFMYGEGEKDTVWRFGAPPNYDLVNKLFEEGRTQVKPSSPALLALRLSSLDGWQEWPVGSLEERVQRLVKTWEMELVHKVRPEDYKSINPEKFRFSLNGKKEITAQQIRDMGGSYNAFLQTSLPPELRIYDPTVETAESSGKEFATTFPRGFAVEILQVISGPPVIVYKFRHWGFMEGPFHGHTPTGDVVQFIGVGIFHVDDGMRVEKVEFFYERGDFLAGFLKGGPSESAAASGSRCPIMNA
ncbi:hypothetical protein OPV22_020621 [Ensete ventricosum]|uniref:Pathogen-related protein n=1 Tax=Ensete ventricosum TaxID=4639 RepID=A0AAV8QJX9_ENSVE|nr:hypothetical protein OPV22_020621 [Ensete ventricosum]